MLHASAGLGGKTCTVGGTQLHRLPSRRCAMAASVSIMLAAEPLLAQMSSAQSWPTKRVSVIVPFSPGSATDLLPRTVFEHVAAKVGQTFIIENRPGGGGAIGVSAVAKADPDGYTILVHSNALVTAPAIQSMPYDPVRDFCRRHAARQRAVGAGDLAREEHQDAQGIRRGGQGEARIDELRRRRHRDAASSHHGTFPPGRRVRRASSFRSRARRRH